MIRKILLTCWLACGIVALQTQRVAGRFPERRAAAFEVNLPVAVDGLDIPVSVRIALDGLPAGSALALVEIRQGLRIPVRLFRQTACDQHNHFSSIKCSVFSSIKCSV